MFRTKLAAQSLAYTITNVAYVVAISTACSYVLLLFLCLLILFYFVDVVGLEPSAVVSRVHTLKTTY